MVCAGLCGPRERVPFGAVAQPFRTNDAVDPPVGQRAERCQRLPEIGTRGGLINPDVEILSF
jgi:hypothetical protein